VSEWIYCSDPGCVFCKREQDERASLLPSFSFTLPPLPDIPDLPRLPLPEPMRRLAALKETETLWVLWDVDTAKEVAASPSIDALAAAQRLLRDT
jgi:hypothetical protein